MMALPITESSNFKILLLWTDISTDILHMEQNNTGLRCRGTSEMDLPGIRHRRVPCVGS